MATSSFAIRRLFVIGGLLVVAATAPAIALSSLPQTGAPQAQCTSGEENDTFTTSCVPFMVPNSPSGFTTTAANPDVPEIDGIPCIGRSGAACIGLAEDQQAMGPPAIPRSTISSSP